MFAGINEGWLTQRSGTQHFVLRRHSVAHHSLFTVFVGVNSSRAGTMSKIAPLVLQEAIRDILTKRKERKFTESIDLQVNLKNYDKD